MMKTKPIIIASLLVVVLICLFFFVKARYFKSHPEKAEILQFLNAFNQQIKAGNTDSALSYFGVTDNKEILTRLINILEEKNGIENNKSFFKLSLNTDSCTLKIINEDNTDAVVAVNFIYNETLLKPSAITFKLRKFEEHSFKIESVDATTFLYDYVSYENFVKSKTLADNDIYAPVTLAAFKTAALLKSKYDSVVWFAHVNKQTYYYVIKGKWDYFSQFEGLRVKDTMRNYQMGLVSPDLKEIIPPEYDLIHNISGTFDGLVEVDKDHKHGFYDLNGKIVLPVIYDEIFPEINTENLAALRIGADYYWLKNDYTVSDKVDLKISDIISNLKQIGSFTLSGNELENVTEFNSHEEHGAVYIPPSYLVDLNLLPIVKSFKNNLRQNVAYEEVSSSYEVNLNKQPNDNNNWFTTAFYSIRDYFLGGRSEFYDSKNLVLTDKRNNKVYSYPFRADYAIEEEDVSLSGKCDEYSLKPLNDSLFELCATATIGLGLYNGDRLSEASLYHYLRLKDSKLAEKQTNRIFAFTKFIKMDDSYLNGCFLYGVKQPGDNFKFNDQQTDRLGPNVLQYMKNEIFADYHYKFKDSTWNQVFESGLANYKGENTTVDDSLTEIDKYNINWINAKLKGLQGKKLASNR